MTKLNVIGVVYHLVPTSNHNGNSKRNLKAQVVYHLVPTSNHNTEYRLLFEYRLYIILFLHQTTTYVRMLIDGACCISSCSYIKPQLASCTIINRDVVYHLVPTSNHNPSSFASNVSLLYIILFLHQTTTHR